MKKKTIRTSGKAVIKILPAFGIRDQRRYIQSSCGGEVQSQRLKRQLAKANSKTFDIALPPPAGRETERIFIELSTLQRTLAKCTHTLEDMHIHTYKYMNARTPLSSPPSNASSVALSAIATHSNAPIHAHTHTPTHILTYIHSNAERCN